MLSLKDRLSRLGFRQACKLLGPKGEKLIMAGGKLLGAAFAFTGEMFPKAEERPESDALANVFETRLSECLKRDENGELKMTITLHDESVLDNFARSLASVVGSR
jgi:hypothetical protein